jgi:hypothetical protein
LLRHNKRMWKQGMLRFLGAEMLSMLRSTLCFE